MPIDSDLLPEPTAAGYAHAARAPLPEGQAEAPAGDHGLIWTRLDEAVDGLPSVFLKALRMGLSRLL